MAHAKDMALKILQNTVYQMVERISECGGVATNGLKAEISALQGKQQPLEEMVATMKRTLDSSKEMLVQKPKCDEEKPSHTEIEKLSKILESHVHALGLCREVKKGCQILCKFDKIHINKTQYLEALTVLTLILML